MSDSVEGTETIAADASTVYALVSDLPRMGEWSPENDGGEWVGGADAAVVGAGFRGHNRNGSKSWSTTSTVTDAQPERRFAFDVRYGPFPISEWSYDLAEDPGAGGTRVTERWVDKRNAMIRALGGVFAGVSDRPTFNGDSIKQTLAALKREAETAG